MGSIAMSSGIFTPGLIDRFKNQALIKPSIQFGSTATQSNDLFTSTSSGGGSPEDFEKQYITNLQAADKLAKANPVLGVRQYLAESKILSQLLQAQGDSPAGQWGKTLAELQIITRERWVDLTRGLNAEDAASVFFTSQSNLSLEQTIPLTERITRNYFDKGLTKLKSLYETELNSTTARLQTQMDAKPQSKERHSQALFSLGKLYGHLLEASQLSEALPSEKQDKWTSTFSDLLEVAQIQWGLSLQKTPRRTLEATKEIFQTNTTNLEKYQPYQMLLKRLDAIKQN